MPEILLLSCRLYRWLLVLYPPALRSRFGEDMADAFEQQIWDEWKAGKFSGIARVWSCAAEELIRIALPSRLGQGTIRVPVLSLLSSLALFLLFFWAVAPPVHCAK
jgi:hypothetical protein